MSLYYFLTRYVLRGQKILVYCYGVTCIENERCFDAVNNDKYEQFMKKDVVLVLSNYTIPDTIVIYVE